MGENSSQLRKTLVQAIRYFSDQDVCVGFVAKLRWPDGPICPSCDGKQHSYLKTRRVWKCKSCKRQFSVKVGTVFEDSPIPLDEWLAAIWMLANSKDGASSHEMARSLGITPEVGVAPAPPHPAGYVDRHLPQVLGQIEVDETFIGGKARNMHKSVQVKKITGAGGTDKTAVVGIFDRNGEVRTYPVPTPSGGPRKAKSASTSSLARPSTRTRSRHTQGWMRTSPTRRWTTPSCTFAARSTPTGWKLLELGQARAARHLRLRGALPPVPLPGRTDVHFNRRKANDFTRFAW
jgi:hypothetical protein